jgi:hypothetical protein
MYFLERKKLQNIFNTSESQMHFSDMVKEHLNCIRMY